jgi:uncharacterized protein
VRFKNFVASDGRTALRVSKTVDNIQLHDGTIVHTASHSSIYAEMIDSMRRDGPLASLVAFLAVSLVVIFATASLRGAVSVLLSLVIGFVCLLGGASIMSAHLHYINFIAIPITLGIGCEYPFNIFDRTRLLGGDIRLAIKRSAGPVALCSYTTMVGYGSLLFNDFGALKSFGRLAIAGELATVVAALVFLPAFLHLWPVRSKTEQGR